MSYTALYRKWRPASFGDVKGQDAIVQTLKNQITSQRAGHAYLFCGTRGTGKTSIAKIFARAVNCEHPKDGSPCNECASCKAIASGSSMNVVEIDAASNNGVENIRDIREQVQYPPTEGRYRVYIIDEVHMLSIGAFNALLKTLEEPPSYVIFILATTEVHKIPITILSRCQRYDFKRISLETIADRLQELTTAEQIEVEERALRYIAKAADGSMRDALSLLDQCVAFHFGKALTYENVLEVLGAVDTSVFTQMFRAVEEGRTRDCILILEEMVVQGRELGQFVADFIWYLRNLLLLKSADDPQGLVDASQEHLKQMEEDAKRADSERLMRYIRTFSDLSNQLRYGTQKRVLVEVALIRLTKPAMETSLDAVTERLNRLEELMEELETRPVSVTAAPAISQVTEEKTETPANVAQTGNIFQKTAPVVSLPAAQLEDLNLIRNEWGKLVRAMSGGARAYLRDTVVEPSGEGCLTIVFMDVSNYEMGKRPTVIGQLESLVQEKYGKTIYFKTRLAGRGEAFQTIYVTQEELHEKIHMDITYDDNNDDMI